MLYGQKSEIPGSAADPLRAKRRDNAKHVVRCVYAVRALAQDQADRITQGNIARMRAILNAETNAGKRVGLEKILAEQEELLTRPDQESASR